MTEHQRGRAGGLPTGHQVAVRAGRRPPVGRGRELLGLSDQLLLAPGCLATLRVELGGAALADFGVAGPVYDLRIKLLFPDDAGRLRSVVDQVASLTDAAAVALHARTLGNSGATVASGS